MKLEAHQFCSQATTRATRCTSIVVVVVLLYIQHYCVSVFSHTLGLGYDEGHNPIEKRGCYPSRGMGKGQRRKR